MQPALLHHRGEEHTGIQARSQTILVDGIRKADSLSRHTEGGGGGGVTDAPGVDGAVDGRTERIDILFVPLISGERRIPGLLFQLVGHLPQQMIDHIQIGGHKGGNEFRENLQAQPLVRGERLHRMIPVGQDVVLLANFHREDAFGRLGHAGKQRIIQGNSQVVERQFLVRFQQLHMDGLRLDNGRFGGKCAREIFPILRGGIFEL